MWRPQRSNRTAHQQRRLLEQQASVFLATHGCPELARLVDTPMVPPPPPRAPRSPRAQFQADWDAYFAYIADTQTLPNGHDWQV